ncbi:MAG: aminoacyl-tRNA hydrolase [Acidobacteria bacterium]|nr:MAG: aminoacyl-tRNA hydrolase [Acidobacteriota bacterium]
MAHEELQADRALVCGLGNPGARYRDTRHNVGFRVIEELARRCGVELGERLCGARVGRSGRLVLAQPRTYMNRSGHAVRCLVESLEIAPQRVLIVYDEVHLPLGRLRLRRRGSPAGHRGMASVLESLGTDEVPRLRVGIAGEDLPAPGEELVDYVLSPFSAAEEDVIAAAVERAAEACQRWLEDGIEAAMQEFNA